jgi:hypothetical protein
MKSAKTFFPSITFGKKLRYIISLAALVAANGISNAQSFVNTPNDTIDMVGMMEDLETLSIQQLNISSDTITLKWKKVSESVPLLWEASVCDNSFCNTTLLDSGMMSPVIPTDFGLLLLHITPHVNYGTAIVRYAVWDIANPTLKDTLTYILTVINPVGISETENKIAFNLFPNPANTIINFVSNGNNGFQYTITDVLGRLIERGTSNVNSISIGTENLANGIYSVSLLSENNIINTHKIIVQH